MNSEGPNTNHIKKGSVQWNRDTQLNLQMTKSEIVENNMHL